MHKSGFVSIIGRPNVGKSTLLNCILNQKLSIVSSKPQTTRSNIIGILDSDDYQLIFTDTPGYHKPRHKLGEYMIKSISEGVKEVDVVLFVANYRKEILDSEIEIFSKIDNRQVSKIFVLNKIDEIKPEDVFLALKKYSEVVKCDEYVPISALKGKNLDRLLDVILKYVPEGPKYYDKEQSAVNNERFFVSEIVREKILKIIRDEVPHGIGVEITQMKYDENQKKYNVEGNIFCEKDTHKPIIIGRNGEILKKISMYSRYDIEKLLHSKVYIRLWVKVRKNWRDDSNHLRSLGYN